MRIIPAFLSLLLLIFSAESEAIPALSIGPSQMTARPGDIFNIQVDVSGISDLYAFQFDVAFDPSILSVTSVQEGTFLQGAGTTFFIPGTIDNVSGVVAFNAGSVIGPSPGVTGSGTLVSFQFAALALGSSTIVIQSGILLGSDLNPIQFMVENGAVAAVPESGTLLLLTSGIALLVVQKRRAVRMLQFDSVG